LNVDCVIWYTGWGRITASVGVIGRALPRVYGQEINNSDALESSRKEEKAPEQVP
jgi:hypothetical protein